MNFKSTTGWLLFMFINLGVARASDWSTLEAGHQLRKRDGAAGGINGTQCEIYPVTIESWNQLGVDEFVLEFPGGKDAALDEFTYAHHITNFVCGLGENCLVGQQCMPFQGPLWFMLYSLQEWNLYVNSLYEATSAAVAQIREMSTSMIADFFIFPTLHEKEATRLALLLVAVTGVTLLGLSVGLFGPALFPAWGVATAEDLAEEEPYIIEAATSLHRKRSLEKRALEPSTLSTLTLDAITQGQGVLSEKLQTLTHAKIDAERARQLRFSQDPYTADAPSNSNVLQALQDTVTYLKKDSAWAPLLTSVLSGDLKGLRKFQQNIDHALVDQHVLVKRSSSQHTPIDNFAVWNLINTYLTSFSDHLRSVVAVTSQIGITAPISSDEGVWGIIQKGKFVFPNPNMSQLQEKIRETMRLSALAQVLKAMNVFVTIGSDKCNKKGPNGAWDGKNHLSHCTPEGLMMNLIRAAKDESVNELENAHLISEKYGYSVEFLANAAWSCQQQNLQIEGRPKAEGLKLNSKVGCTFDLPVCDTRIPEVARLRKKHKSTVVACRKGLALDI